MKKFLRITGISLFSLLFLLFLLPLLFKGKFLALAKEEINKNLVATVDFDDLSLSFFRHFPKLSVGLEGVRVMGAAPFQKDTLLSARRVDVSLNLWSVFSDDVQIKGVFLQKPRIQALVSKEGKANWEIAKEDTGTNTPEAPSAFHVELEKYVITEGYIYYKDESSNLTAEVSGLNHQGSGNFTQDLFTLSTTTNADAAGFTYAGIPYLVNARTGVEAAIEIDNKNSKYAFKKTTIRLNDLQLLLDGFLKIENDSTYTMDIAFDAPSNEFKNILSLVPAVYKADFHKLKTSGTALLKGFVKGTYSPQHLPAFDVDLQVKDGFFQYPDLPQPVKNIQMAARFSNPDGLFDHTVINIAKGHLEMGAEPFDFRLLFKQPETSKYIDATVKGSLNLSELSKFVKLEAGTKLSGILSADAYAKGNLSALENQKGPFSAGGFFDLRSLAYQSKDLPQPVRNGNFKIQIINTGGLADATTIEVASGHLEVGNDPLDFSLTINRPVSVLNFSGTAKGRFSLDNVGQFVKLEPGTGVKGLLSGDLRFSGSKDDIERERYERIHTAGTLALSGFQFTSKDYPTGVQVQTAALQFTPQQVVLNNLKGQFQNTNISASGVLNNLLPYALRNEELQGTVNIAADKVNLNDWMGTAPTEGTSGTPSAAPFLVPANLHLLLKARAGQVHYDKVDYTNIQGDLLLKDETVHLQNLQTEALEGRIRFDGSYSTLTNKEKPAISIRYDIQEVDVQKAFYAYNTVQKLMPLGKFLAGKISSQFSMTGALKGDMFPDLSSLSGNGNLLLIEGVLSKFAPLEKLASTLNISEFNNLSLRDIKSQFEFANGKVLVKPFDVKVKDINMQIGGMHGFDQSINYLIGLKVPRRYLGAGGNALVNNLAAKATAKGIPVTVSDVLNLNVRMGGSITSPVLTTDLQEVTGNVAQEMKQQAATFVQQKIDSARHILKDSLNSVKKDVANIVTAEIGKQLFGKKDSTDNSAPAQNVKEKATETLKNKLGNLLKKKKAESSDTTGTGQ